MSTVETLSPSDDGGTMVECVVFGEAVCSAVVKALMASEAERTGKTEPPGVEVLSHPLTGAKT